MKTILWFHLTPVRMAYPTTPQLLQSLGVIRKSWNLHYVGLHWRWAAFSPVASPGLSSETDSSHGANISSSLSAFISWAPPVPELEPSPRPLTLPRRSWSPYAFKTSTTWEALSHDQVHSQCEIWPQSQCELWPGISLLFPCAMRKYLGRFQYNGVGLIIITAICEPS